MFHPSIGSFARETSRLCRPCADADRLPHGRFCPSSIASRSWTNRFHLPANSVRIHFEDTNACCINLHRAEIYRGDMKLSMKYEIGVKVIPSLAWSKVRQLEHVATQRATMLLSCGWVNQLQRSPQTHPETRINIYRCGKSIPEDTFVKQARRPLESSQYTIHLRRS